MTSRLSPYRVGVVVGPTAHRDVRAQPTHRNHSAREGWTMRPRAERSRIGQAGRLDDSLGEMGQVRQLQVVLHWTDLKLP